MPGGLSRGRQMVDAASQVALQPSRDSQRRDVCNEFGGSGGAMLIGNDAQGVPFLGKAQDCLCLLYTSPSPRDS